MSVTIGDLLKLPCMHGAQVAGGRNGLGQAVEYVTVLEFSRPELMQEDVYSKLAPIRNEIIITALADIARDVPAQCEVLRYQKEMGDVGLILYYVGLVVPEIDPRLAALADALAFPLICMPRGDNHLRYSDAIREIMELIIRDQHRSEYFLPDILRIVTAQPPEQRSVGGMLKLLAAHTHTELLLTDPSWKPLACALSPRRREQEAAVIAAAVAASTSAGWVETPQGRRCFAIDYVQQRRGGDLCLIVLEKDGLPAYNLVQQLQEAVQLLLALYSESYTQADTAALADALLQGEGLMAARLAAQLRLDAAQFTSLAVLRPARPEGWRDARRCAERVREELSRRYPACLIENYHNAVVILGDAAFGRRAKAECRLLVESLAAEGTLAAAHVGSYLPGTEALGRAWQLSAAAAEAVGVIFAGQPVLTLGQLETAAECLRLYQQGGEELSAALQILQPLQQVEQPLRRELYQTLAVYLLDEERHIARTAERLYLHKNTIKYRIKKINDYLGFAVSQMPEAAACYRAAALLRLTEAGG